MALLSAAVVFAPAMLLAAPPKAPAAAPAPPPPPPPADVETAEQLYARLEYEQANQVAERVTRLRGLSHDQLVRAYRVLAVTNGVLDREEQSKEAFIQLLTYDPDYQVDQNLGPKVSTPFSEARGFWRAQSGKPALEVQASPRGKEAGTMRATLRDPTRVVKKLVFAYRWGASGDFTTKAQSPSDNSIELPAPPPERTRLDYYVLATDDRDNVVLEHGNAQAPKTTFAENKGAAGSGAEASSGFFGSTTFWILAGALAVAGGGAATYFALRPQDPPTSATLTPILNCGAGVRCQ